MMINRIMLNGKKSVVTRHVYNAIDMVAEKTGKDGIEVFETALKNVSPMMEVRPAVSVARPIRCRWKSHLNAGLLWQCDGSSRCTRKIRKVIL